MPSIKEIIKKCPKDKASVKAIRSCAAVYAITKNKGGEHGFVNCELVDRFKSEYDGLSFEVLIALWYDNYNSKGFAIERTGGLPMPTETVEVAVSNKMVALGMLLNEGW